MFTPQAVTGDHADYTSLLQQVEAMLHGEHDPIANAANLSALIFYQVPRLNWVGFYFVRGDELVVGPFQGLPACVRIAHGRGVCGTAWAEAKTQCVDDVHAFSGHIACDAASRSEVVVPIKNSSGQVVAVLDIDSPEASRFSAVDVAGLEAVAMAYQRASGDSK